MKKLTRYIIIGLATLAICLLVWFFRTIVIYFFIAGILSLLAYPIMSFLKRIRYKKFHIPHTLSAIITLLILYSTFTFIFVIIIPIIVEQVRLLYNVDINHFLETVSKPIASIEHLIQQYIPNQQNFSLKNHIQNHIQELISIDIITDIFGSLTLLIKDLLIGLFATTFLTFFFLKEEGLFFKIIIFLFPERLESNITRALQSIYHLLVRYFIGICLDISTVFGLNTLGLIFIANISWQTAIVMGVITGVLNIIPYVGPLLGMATAIAVGLTAILSHAAIVNTLLLILLVFIITQIIDMGVLQPFIYSNSVQAHPLEIFLVIFAAGSIGGIVAMLVAIPSYTVLRVLAKEFFHQYRLVQKLTDKIK